MKSDKGLRMEFYELVSEMTDEEKEYYRDILNIKPPKAKTTYRRIYPKLADIDMPKEIPNDEEHTMLVFKDDTFTIVKGSYDDVCFDIDEREAIQDYGNEE